MTIKKGLLATIIIANTLIHTGYIYADDILIPEDIDISALPVRRLQKDPKKEKEALVEEIVTRMKSELTTLVPQKQETEKTPEIPSKQSSSKAEETTQSSVLWKDIEFSDFISQELDKVFDDDLLQTKRIDIDTPSIDIKTLMKMICQLSGINLLIDSSIAAKSGNIHLKQKTPGEILKVICKNSSPQLAVVAIDKDVWKIIHYKDAEDLLGKKYRGAIAHEVFSINHTNITTDFREAITTAWAGINGGQKDPSKYLHIDEREKKILVRGHPTEISEFSRVLSKIDKPIIQVKIDAIIVFVKKGTDFTFGIDWSGIYNRQQTMEEGRGAGFWGTGARVTDFPKPTEGDYPKNTNILVNPKSFALNLFSSISQMFTSAVDKRITDFIQIPFVFGGPDLNLKRLNLMLNAAEAENKVKIVSRPTILTGDNEKALLTIGSKLPISTAVQDVTQSTTRNITTINFKDTGITLDVRPIVNADRTITLYLDVVDMQLISGGVAVDSKTGVNPDPPIISIFEAKNTVTLRSGQTTIIGGMSVNQVRTASNRMPILSKLPIFGKILFQSDFDLSQDTEQFIFITPTLLEQEKYSLDN
jgi:hypothetical protein